MTRVAERMRERVGPAPPLPGVVALVEHHPPAAQDPPIPLRLREHLLVRQRGPAERLIQPRAGDLAAELDSRPVRPDLPLPAEMRGRTDHRQGIDVTVGQGAVREVQRERGLPGAGRRLRQEIPRPAGVFPAARGFLLPTAQP